MRLDWPLYTLLRRPSMILRKYCMWAAVLSLIVPFAAFCQTATPRLTFDVASIKPSEPNDGVYGIKPLPGGNGYTAQHVSVKLMMALMYKVPTRQITGAPDWMDTEPFDIEARVDGSHSVDDLHVMFQNLLADRFHLKFHKETKEGPVYALSVGKSGLKMKADGTGQALQHPDCSCRGWQLHRDQSADAIPMLVAWASASERRAPSDRHDWTDPELRLHNIVSPATPAQCFKR